MITSFFASFAFYLIAYFVVMKSPLSRQVNAFTFLAVTCAHTNFFIIIEENFTAIQITNDPDHYVAFLLARNLLVPLLVLFGVNLYFRSESALNRLGVSLLTIGSLLLLAYTCRKLEFYTWVNWKAPWTPIYYSSLYLLGVLSVIGVRKLVPRAGRVIR